MAEKGKGRKPKLSLPGTARIEAPSDEQPRKRAAAPEPSPLSRYNMPEAYERRPEFGSGASFRYSNDLPSQEALTAPVPTQGLSKWRAFTNDSSQSPSANASAKGSLFNTGRGFIRETHVSRTRRGEGEDLKRRLEELALKFKRPSPGQDTAVGFNASPSQGSYNDDRLPLGRGLSQHSFKMPRLDNTCLKKDAHPSPVGHVDQYGSPRGYPGLSFVGLRKAGTLLRDPSPFPDDSSVGQKGMGTLPRQPGAKPSSDNTPPIQAKRSRSVPRALTSTDVERYSPTLSTDTPEPRKWNRVEHRDDISKTNKPHVAITKDTRADLQTRDRGFDIVDENRIINRISGDELKQEKPDGKKIETRMEILERENVENAIASANYQSMVNNLEKRHAAAETEIKSLEIRTIEDAKIIMNHAIENEELKTQLITAENKIKRLETKDRNVAVNISSLKAKIWELEEEQKVAEIRTTKLERDNLDERAKSEEYQDELHKYKAAMLTLIDDLVTMRRADPETSASIVAFQVDHGDEIHEPEECILLRAELAQSISRHVSRTSDLKKQNKKFMTKIREQEQTMKTLEGRLRGYAAIERSDEVNDEDTTQKDSKLKILEDKQKSFDFLDRKYKNLKAMIIEMDPKALNNELIEIREKYTELRDRHNLLVHERDEWKTIATSWEEDYQTATKHYELEKAGLQSAIHAVQQENLHYIEEYHDHLPKNNSNWFEIEFLQKKIKTLEDDKKDLLKEKGSAEKRRDDAVMQFKYLRAALNAGETITYHPASSSSNPLLSFLHDPHSTKNTYRPKYESNLETEKRSTYLKGFKKSQKALRANEYVEEELVGKARKWMMEEKYPSGLGRFKEQKKKRTWDRWDVDRYLESKVATTKDRDVAQKIGK